MLCAPAFAGVATLASHGGDACGCATQAKQPEQTTIAHSDGVVCHCAGCGCSFEELPTPTPYDGVATAPSIVWVALPAAEVAPLDTVRVAATPRDGATKFARGPPELYAAPLYILYDSFLI